MTAKSGPLADENLYRFSTKEIHAASGMYYYLFRFYDPNLQRWINKNPINELGFDLFDYPRSARHSYQGHAFTFLSNDAVALVDPFGLKVGPGKSCTGSDAKKMHDDFLERCKIAKAGNCFDCLGKRKADMNDPCDPNKYGDVVVECEDKNVPNCLTRHGKGGPGCGWPDTKPSSDYPGKTVVHVCMGMSADSGCADTGCSLLHEVAHPAGGVGGG